MPGRCLWGGEHTSCSQPWLKPGTSGMSGENPRAFWRGLSCAQHRWQCCATPLPAQRAWANPSPGTGPWITEAISKGWQNLQHHLCCYWQELKPAHTTLFPLHTSEVRESFSHPCVTSSPVVLVSSCPVAHSLCLAGPAAASTGRAGMPWAHVWHQKQHLSTAPSTVSSLTCAQLQ